MICFPVQQRLTLSSQPSSCRRNLCHPVKEQTTAAARPVLLRCRVRLAPVKGSGHLARVAPPLARWWFGSRSLGVPAFLSGSRARHIVQASSRSLRRVGAGRRLLPLPLSRQTQPQTCQPRPYGRLRLPWSVSVRRPRYAAAGVGVLPGSCNIS